jgi:hypothetical protein
MELGAAMAVVRPTRFSSGVRIPQTGMAVAAVVIDPRLAPTTATTVREKSQIGQLGCID